jgi:large subunit ribosomal protein L17
MRHRIAGRTFGRRSGPRKALLRGLISNLIDAERITTTVAKAKELRMHVEPLITLAKRGDLHARRQIAGQVYTKENVQKLFDDLAVRFKDRNGGYTRIFKANQRLGDGAPMAMIEFLDRKIAEKGEAKKTAPKKKAESKKAAPKKEAAAAKPAKASNKSVAKKAPVKKSSSSK